MSRNIEGGKHNAVAVVLGLSGAGKDHLLGKAVGENLIPPEVTIFSFGSVMLGILKGTYPTVVKDRDDIKKLNVEQVRGAVIQGSETVTAKQPAIVQGHLITHMDGKLERFDYAFTAMCPRTVVHVLADKYDIKERRASDLTRNRVVQSVGEIEDHQGQSLEAARNMARKLEAEMVELWNYRDNVGENIAVLGEKAKMLMRRND